MTTQKCRCNENYLNYLLKIRKNNYLVSEEIALIRQNNLKEQDISTKFVPSNRFQGLI